MFSLASTLLFKIASPAIKKAYQKVRSISEAKDDLSKLQRSIQTIQAVLLDAEKRQQSSDAIKDWIDKVRDVLYDADDLFDEVATADEMLKQQIIREGKTPKKVQASCSNLNYIAKEVKAIKKRLDEISNDMERFNFVICEREEPITGARIGQDQGSFVDPKEVFGRDNDKKDILKLLLHDQSGDVVSVIAVVGIGGMGKTTFAQLVYNDEDVMKNFKKRGFACISDIFDDKEVIGKIFQSICDKQSYGGFNLGQLQAKIRESIKGKKILLVLDDVWDDDRGRWIHRMSLFKGCAQGSKIIVTTRSLSVARAMDAHTLQLDGLSEDASWDLFRKVAFTPAQEASDPRWTDLGREIVKKCANVPLAIRSIGSLLYKKNTIQEWKSFKNEELAKLGESDQNPVMSVLKLSYDHLHSNLKQCFVYCSVFPKDYVFEKRDLIYLWIAQGYIKTNGKEKTFEEVGHSYFMDLFRMSFFQEAKYDDDFGDQIESCKMHDLIHDLAQQVAAEESITLITPRTEIKGTPRHAYVYCIEGDPLTHHPQLWNGNRLRTLLSIGERFTYSRQVLDQEFAKLKFLRALKLSSLGIENVPSSIGELKLLRYLDISLNKFERLPDSITKLLNLYTLDLHACDCLEALPNEFRKLVNLRQLDIKGCRSLRYMPPGFDKLISLQYLDVFKVCSGMDRDQCSKLGDVFGRDIRGQLSVDFGDDSNNADWNGAECWQPLVNLEGFYIGDYNGIRIPRWANERSADSPSSLLLPNLRTLCFCSCHRVKCLPPFKHLPNLKFLLLNGMRELEYIEEEEEEENGGKENLTAGSDALFLPPLKKLTMMDLPKVKGWSRKVEAAMTSKGDNVTAKGEEHSSSTSAISCAQLPSFSSLSELFILDCKQLKYLPLCPSVRKLSLFDFDTTAILPLLPCAIIWDDGKELAGGELWRNQDFGAGVLKKFREIYFFCIYLLRRFLNMWGSDE